MVENDFIYNKRQIVILITLNLGIIKKVWEKDTFLNVLDVSIYEYI